MNFEEALKLLKAGKKIRRKDWKENHDKRCFIFGDELCCESEGGVIGYVGLSIKNMLATDWEEYKEPLLTEEEKEYLKMIIKFNLFKVKTVEITRPDHCWDGRHFILLRGYNDDEDASANFIKTNYFKNLENTKPYTLKELELDEPL